MTDKQKQMARTLEYFPFEHGSPVARFVARMANYAKYSPEVSLGNEDAKQLQRLFDTYVRDQQAVKQP